MIHNNFNGNIMAYEIKFTPIGESRLSLYVINGYPGFLDKK